MNLYDSTGDTEYTYDGLGRITSVTTYRTPATAEDAEQGEDSVFSHEETQGDTIGYTYDEADNLSAITYPDGTQVLYEYDLNDNLIKVTDREGAVTTYVYDAINRVTEIHRPNGISTYNTYNARNQITELQNLCDDCEWVVSSYSYTYDDRGFIVAETAIESLAGYAYDDKHNGKHTDGRHDDLYPHGTKHAKHDKDATFAYQIVQTDRTFTYDDAGKLLSSTETEDNYGTYVYTYEYDLMGNRTAMTKTAEDGTVAEWHTYEYNESNQLVSEELYNGKKTTSLSYEYDADGNRISETGKIGTDKVQLTYEYTVENRLEAVYDADELLVAMAYDGDGNRVFQLNYNLHTDDDWKGNSGNGNGSNKDNAGSGSSSGNSNGSDNSDSSADSDSSEDSSSSNNGNGKNNGNTKKNNSSTETEESEFTDVDTSTDGTTTENENTESADSSTSADTGNIETASSTGNGNATNAEENNSQNQCGILFPVDSEVSDTEQSLIDKIKTTGKEKNYELIEYINDVNREYTEVLVEQNINGKLDTAYVYGNDRLSLDRFDGSNGYYLYDPRGSVTGITNEEGQLYQSYRYDAFGNITFGAPQYENEYTYNGESYNPNIESQYLRARYYDVVNGNFLTEDSYLGSINQPLTLNRYNYCVSSPLTYQDPSGHINEFTDYAEVGDSLRQLFSWSKGDHSSDSAIEQNRKARKYEDYVEICLHTGALDSALLYGMDSTVGALVFVHNAITPKFLNIDYEEIRGTVENYLWKKTGTAIDVNLYRIGRCSGDVTFLVIDIVGLAGAIKGASGIVKKVIKNFDSLVAQAKNILGKMWDNVADFFTGKNSVGDLNGLKVDFYVGPEGIASSLDEYDNFAKNNTEVVEDIIEDAIDNTTDDIAEAACFVAGTTVKTSDGDKCIEEIEVGDFVYAKNAETGECGWKKVVCLFVKQTTELIHIQIGEEVIETTPTHPFWVDGYGFRAAGELVAGNWVETANGELLQVDKVEKVYPDEPVTVYNIEVEDWHTYYVSEEEILVHNMCMQTHGGESGSGSTASKPVYKPSPKHDPVSGWGSQNPIPDVETGQALLDTAYSSSKNKQLYNIYNGELIKFQPDTVEGWHAYLVNNTSKEVPTDVLRQMLDDGIITNAQYKKFTKNK